MAKKNSRTQSLVREINRTLELSKGVIDSLSELRSRRPTAVPGGPAATPAVGHKATPYEILGVPRDVTRDQLKKAHRYLAKHYHSDAGSGSDAMMKILNNAYDEIMEEKGWRKKR